MNREQNADPHRENVLILDFGSQYTMLIARRVRELGVYCEILPPNVPLARIREKAPIGVLLSGGPSSVYQDGAPRPAPGLFALGVPILGICYGFQLMALELGGRVERSDRREYGHAEVTLLDHEGPFRRLRKGEHFGVWMSHGDRVEALPEGFVPLAESDNAPYAAAGDPRRKIYGVQFHPEVTHTPLGREILKGFLFDVAGASGTWTMAGFVESETRRVRELVGDGRVICALSGGVDSSVVAVLLHRAIGDRLTCILVDNGLLREGEARSIERLFSDRFSVDLRLVDATDRFLARLKDVVDPEEKRKIIGREFIGVFEEAAQEVEDARFLAQGTLYPDVIESVSFRGPSATIKSHHNVGGLPDRMNLKLIEPLRELFKDEVRRLGRDLGLPEQIVGRHPFPGPGLAVRIVGDVTRENLAVLRAADRIVVEEVREAGWYDKVWQAFAVLLPIRSVGVMGDERTYERVAVLRAVHSVDGMTADWVQLPYGLLGRISRRIINEVKGVNRVVYDISSKPPSTIEWE